MDFIKNLFKPKEPLLSPADMQELRAIERESYMAEARKIVKDKAIDNARRNYAIIKPKESWA